MKKENIWFHMFSEICVLLFIKWMDFTCVSRKMKKYAGNARTDKEKRVLYNFWENDGLGWYDSERDKER